MSMATIFQKYDMEAEMKELIKVMKAGSDPTRVKILKMLQRKTMCVCEIQATLKIAQSTASKHLKILEEAGLISSAKEGLWVNYILSDGFRSPFAATFLGNLKHWLENDPEILALINRLPFINREQICGK
jgi:ArsR family transcriptional regulator, arsenate/arsenite/antimonite-responsive transcriptional repressor